MKAQMNRREFLTYLVIAASLPDSDLEAKVREKVYRSVNITPYALQQIKSLKLFREQNISLIYNIFENTSNSEVGTGSMNFNKDKRVMDLGIDNFEFITDILLFLGSSFLGSIFGSSKKCKALYDLEDIRNFLEFDENFVWKHYREGIPIKGNPKTTPLEYELVQKTVKLDSKDIVSSKNLIHNPLSAAFEILNGNKINNFEMIANGNYSKSVKITYEPYNWLEDFSIVEVEFENPVIKKFKKVHALVYNNVPIAGYIKQEDKEMEYIRGELADIKVDGKTILETLK
ncbi:MAG: hypothetical protein ABIH65_03490 [Nanoarchaeota archaeon]